MERGDRHGFLYAAFTCCIHNAFPHTSGQHDSQSFHPGYGAGRFIGYDIAAGGNERTAVAAAGLC